MVHFIPDFKDQFLDSVRSCISRTPAMGFGFFFFKRIRFSVASLCNFSGADSDFKWPPWPPAGIGTFSAQSCCSPNPMAYAHCSWSRPRRTSGGMLPPPGLQWSVLKRQSCCRQHQGSAPSALCSASSDIRSTMAVLESAELGWRKSVISLSRGKCIYCYTTTYSKLVCLYLCIALNYAIAKPY